MKQYVDHLNTERLGISASQLSIMQRGVTKLEQQNDAIGDTKTRHAISLKLVEIRLLLRDGDLRNLK